MKHANTSEGEWKEAFPATAGALSESRGQAPGASFAAAPTSAVTLVLKRLTVTALLTFSKMVIPARRARGQGRTVNARSVVERFRPAPVP